MLDFSDKEPSEEIRVAVDFEDRIPSGATVVSGDCAVTLLSGTDAGYASLLSGAASASGTQVRQLLVGGVSGAQYRLEFSATLSDDQVLVEIARIRVRA